MKPLRIFIDFPAPSEVLELLREGTRGHELVFPKTPAASNLTKGERDPQFASVDVAFGQPDPVQIAESSRLQWAHISSSGIARYDNPEFRAQVKERKIAVSNSAGVYRKPCAVHVLGFMLAQARQLPRGLATRTAGGSACWHALRGSSGTLCGETLLILGFGAIGKCLTDLLRPFEMKITAYRRRARGDEGVPVITTGMDDDLRYHLGRADHVVNILPDSPETRGFFDRTRFEGLKPGAVFYNIGRGTTVVQEALLESLRSGWVGAAWLDVTDPEPLPDDHPLWAEENCHITPHVAGGHIDEAQSLAKHFLKNLDRFIRGEPLLDRVM